MYLRIFACLAITLTVAGISTAQTNNHVGNYDRYFENLERRIQHVKHIPESLYADLYTSFVNTIKKSPFDDYASAARVALQKVWPDTSVFSYIYRSEIRREGMRYSNIERLSLINHRHLSKTSFEKISLMVDRKCYNQALIIYTYAAHPALRDSLLRLVSARHDMLIETALLRDGSAGKNNLFSIALKYRNAIGISEDVIDSLVKHGLYLSWKEDSIRKRDPFGDIDFKAYEAKWLRKLLTEEEHSKVLSIKNRNKALMEAEDDWVDMIDMGIANEMNEAKVKKRLSTYYLKKWNIYYRYADNISERRRQLALLQQQEPPELIMLHKHKNMNVTQSERSTSLEPKW